MKIKQVKFANDYQRAMLNVIFTANWLEVGISQLLKKYDMSSQQYNVLRILRGSRPKPLNLLDIQERMMDKMSNATRLVEKLRQKGLLTRIQCPTNRRKVEIEITEKGMEVLKELDPAMDQNDQLLATKLTAEEVKLLGDLLDKLREL